MTTVSVSAYNDADLLHGCLYAVRTVLGNVRIQVVDGRYATWPDAPDNSTEAMPQVCDAYGAEYYPNGPYPREEAKHEHRLALAPDGERCLFLDADERLVAFDDALPEDTPLKVRFHHPVTYSETREVFYYPRVFQPEWVERYTRTDLPEFRPPFDDRLKRRGQTDAVTIAHRHDLRGLDYREAKLERLAAEDRSGVYAKAPERYLDEERPPGADPCPECGERTLYRTTETAHGVGISRVATCVNGECYLAVEPIDVGEHRYLPDDIETGYVEEPDRLRLELLDAGVTLFTYHHVHDFAPMLLEWMVDHDPETEEWPSLPHLPNQTV